MADAIARFTRAGIEHVSALTRGEGNEASAVVDQIQAAHQFRASVFTVRVADDMMASLLDLQRARP